MKIIKGTEYKRKELHDYYGGQRQGGISTPIDHRIIFIFQNKRGEDYGYEDGWNEDNHFLYTGEGQIGDMEFKKGNKALRDHSFNEKKVFLFKETKKTFVRFVAEISFIEYEFIQIPDINKNNRRAIQFIFKKIE